MTSLKAGGFVKYSAVLLLAGKSKRFNGDINKVYTLINEKPLFQYSLEVFNKDDNCQSIIIVYNENDKDLLFKNEILSEKTTYVTGGSERYKSVLNGIKNVNTEYVLVHDGARPLISQSMIDDLLGELKYSECVSTGLPITDTIKKIDENGNITTISRDSLYSVQTPQGSKTEMLKSALENVKDTDNITDDLMAIEKYTNITPKIVIGSKRNIKVTTIEDIELVKMYLKLGE